MAKPLSAYIPFANFDSFDPVIPTHEMPWSAEAGYRLLSDNEKALKPPNSAAQSHATQTTKPDDGQYSAKGIYK